MINDGQMRLSKIICKDNSFGKVWPNLLVLIIVKKK